MQCLYLRRVIHGGGGVSARFTNGKKGGSWIADLKFVFPHYENKQVR